MTTAPSAHGEIRIGARLVGASSPVFIIAEAGVNHDGDVDKAYALIDAAADTGADCVKFQTFRAERLVLASAPKAAYQVRNTGAGDGGQLEMLRGLELAEDALPGLIAHCRARGIEFMSTPYSAEDVALLDGYAVDAFKLASIHIAEVPFLAAVAAHGRPMIVSTGMATLGEIDAAVAAMRRTPRTPVVLLQCTTEYPADAASANLRAMVTMGAMFGVPVGYSDHTPGNVACIAAVALGACVIEKHMTLDPTAPGPDHAASLDPRAMRRLVSEIREAESVLGDGWKRPSVAEYANRDAMRRRLVTVRDVAAGEAIAPQLVTFMRADRGLFVAELEQLAGWRAAGAIAAGTPLTWDLLRRGV